MGPRKDVIESSIRIHFCFKTTVIIRCNPNLIPRRAVLGLHVLSWHFLFFPDYPRYQFTIVLRLSSSFPFREFGHLQSSNCGVSSSIPLPTYTLPLVLLVSHLTLLTVFSLKLCSLSFSDTTLACSSCHSGSLLSLRGYLFFWEFFLSVSTLAGSVLDLVHLLCSLHSLLK